jgi:hydroxymethylpyrimidine pyrophosphatase-like HAD family hydrolase
MLKAIICDLDGTLCNDDNRKDNIKDIIGVKEWGEKEYDRYYQNIHTDTVFEHIEEIVQKFYDDNYIILFVTGRPERFRSETNDWLNNKTKLSGHIFMREDNNYESDVTLKTRIYNEHIKPYYDVLFVLEDRTKVVKMWRDLNVSCLQVQQSDF